MPQFKQPSTVQDIAMNCLVSFFKTRFDDCGNRYQFDELGRLVAGIKTDVHPRIPWPLAAEFYRRLLELHPIWFFRYRTAAYKILMQVVMDEDIVGLKCPRRGLEHLDSDELSRIRGLIELDFYANDVPHICSRLRDLRKVRFFDRCTDADLEIIAKNCPRLEHLNVCRSFVTDVGLLSLSQCKKLRCVIASLCPRVSIRGINDLLSANESIRELSAWNERLGKGFDCFSTLDPSAYPSIESFSVVIDLISDEHLRVIVEKFPNLTSLKLGGHVAGDLSVLKSLSKLSKLELGLRSHWTWDDLQSRLICVGDKVNKLSICSTSIGDAMQNELNFIFEVCENLEYLEFSCLVDAHHQTIRIPPFKNLTNLLFNNRGKCQPIVEFGKMLKVKEITVRNCETTLETVTSLILGNVEYPNLKFLSLADSRFHNINGRNSIEKMVQDNNINLEIDITRATATCGKHHDGRPWMGCSFCPMPRR